MADVRSLLRNERAARRITHPNASYSSNGKLTCTTCGISIQSDQEIWNSHLKSTQHAMRAERARLNQKPPTSTLSERQKTSSAASPPNTKKRKAQDPEDDDARKRNKPVEPTLNTTQVIYDDDLDPQPIPELPEPSPDPVKPVVPASNPNPPQGEVDEAEWAAFERDVATPPPPDPYANPAVISAAPVSAAELAEQEEQKAREEGKGKQDLEMEDEKEEATRALEEEFEEMEGLEERLRKLREKREQLRQKAVEEPEQGGGQPQEALDDDGGDSSDDEELDEWGLLK